MAVCVLERWEAPAHIGTPPLLPVSSFSQQPTPPPLSPCGRPPALPGRSYLDRLGEEKYLMALKNL